MMMKTKMHRGITVLLLSTVIWMSGTGMGISGISSSSTAHAAAVATTTATTTTTASSSSSRSIMERILPFNKNNDVTTKIIDTYVRHHIFDDDTAIDSEPLESAYREAFQDYNSQSKGGQKSYPRKIQDLIATEIMGLSSSSASLPSSRLGLRSYSNNNNDGGIIGILTGLTNVMQKRIGLSETTALIIIATTCVIAFPSFLLFGGMILGGISKRNMNNLMKTRYGDTYT